MKITQYTVQQYDLQNRRLVLFNLGTWGTQVPLSPVDCVVRICVGRRASWTARLDGSTPDGRVAARSDGVLCVCCRDDGGRGRYGRSCCPSSLHPHRSFYSHVRVPTHSWPHPDLALLAIVCFRVSGRPGGILTSLLGLKLLLRCCSRSARLIGMRTTDGLAGMNPAARRQARL